MKLKSTIANFSTVALLTISLTSCSVLYPNWNTTAGPSDSATPSNSNSNSPTETASATPAKGKAQVNLIDSGVDVAGHLIYAVAQVTNVSEDGGICTLTFTGVGKTKTISGKAESNVTNTQCHPLEISLADLPKGAGLISVSYNSPTYAGTSAAIAVKIP